MSVDTPQVVEETPVPVKTIPVVSEQPATFHDAVVMESKEHVTPNTLPTTTSGNTEGITTGAAVEQPLEDNKVAVAATPASEGILGYKAPGFLKQFVFSKQHFWLGDEASTPESLSSYVSNNAKVEGHHHAAWAQETGKGVLFHSKRAEDKATPAGMILLSDATNINKEGPSEFSFMVGKKHHKFEAQTTAERDSWIVAIEKAIEESKVMKDEIIGRPSYKETFGGYATSASPLGAAAKTDRSRSKGHRKSLDAATVTAAASEPVAVAAPVRNGETASVSSSDKEIKKHEKAAKKERSQSRVRNSIFGLLNKKDEEKDLKKEEKAEKKVEKHHEKEIKHEQKEHIKEEKKVEAEIKKEEAKAHHNSNHATGAAEAATVAAVPATALATDHKEEPTETVATEKKNKRASVFGNLFAKKGLTSPTSEKTEHQAIIATPVATSEIQPVSETAPKLDEPIENRPIDTAVVTAPAIIAEAPAHHAVTVAPEVAAHETTSPVADVVRPTTEKKGSFLGFMKKAEAKKELKEEVKEEKAAEHVTREPMATTTTNGATEAVAEVPVTAAPVAATSDAITDERPAREKRRSSFFSSLGTIKKRNPETSEAETVSSDIKREKSPLPAKLGGLFRKPSKAVKPSENGTIAHGTADNKVGHAATTVEEPAHATMVEPTESKIVGDVVPASLVAPVQDTTPVVKATV